MSKQEGGKKTSADAQIGPAGGLAAERQLNIEVRRDCEPNDYEEYAPRWFVCLEPKEKASLIIQSVLAVFGIVAVIIYQGQLVEMRTSTQVAIDGVKATQQSVINADLNFRRDERAWIGFSLGPGNINFTVGQPFMVPTVLVNSGKTPAKNVEGNIVVGLFERNKPLNFSYSPGHANYRIGGGTIFPNGQFNESFQAIRHDERTAEAIILTKSMMDQILKSEQLVIVHGRITYNDIFGIEHWTTYCRVVSNPSLIPGDCMKYNDADNNDGLPAKPN